MSNEYRICNKCVMDTTDPDIIFDEDGICNHCHTYEDFVKKFVFSGETGRNLLNSIIKKIKEEGHNKEYDCIVGISGGVDSSYAAYLVKKFELRPLAVHLDNGWDSELAVKNIERLLNKLEIDLFTYVIDWEEFRDLQLAFLKASTPDSEVPTDHAIHAILFKKARDIGTRYIIDGSNIKTETHLPRAWSHGHWDWRYIKYIHSCFGTRPLKTYPHFSLTGRIMNQIRFQRVPILNYIDYSKKDAMKIIEKDLGWKYYGGKHYESIYTRFYQGYILPVKFRYDKRRVHLSSLICSGEITRQDGLNELIAAPYDPKLLQEDIEFALKKLELTEDEFKIIMSTPKKSFDEYPSYDKWIEHPLISGTIHNIYNKFLNNPKIV